MIGPSQSGKTTIVNFLKFNKYIQTTPTRGFFVQDIQCKNVIFNIWDLGDPDGNMAQMWTCYDIPPAAIILVIDSSQHQQIQSNQYFNQYTPSVLDMIVHNEQLNRLPLLVLANKQDLTSSLPPTEIITNLHLENILEPRQWHIQGCSAINGDGLQEGIDWLAGLFGG